uniref:HTH myb-type domain-containing protein n=1 Tax=Guillardia theta TaxID=55529 RepID=A0A7S4NE03_GUITH|mmetsp:Transcript_20855/g.69628  ORF Transcript_20855/g.69628 Transcript_20855/m.69628 type:complete len:399 (+) Transcript_20855:124-1320(+)
MSGFRSLSQIIPIHESTLGIRKRNISQISSQQLDQDIIMRSFHPQPEHPDPNKAIVVRNKPGAWLSSQLNAESSLYGNHIDWSLAVHQRPAMNHAAVKPEYFSGDERAWQHSLDHDANHCNLSQSTKCRMNNFPGGYHRGGSAPPAAGRSVSNEEYCHHIGERWLNPSSHSALIVYKHGQEGPTENDETGAGEVDATRLNISADNSNHLGFLVGSEMTEDTTLIALYEVAHENMELKMRLKKISNELGHLQAMVQQKNMEEELMKQPQEWKSRYWTAQEHQRFLDGLKVHGQRNFKAIATLVGTRTSTQVKTHAQKYFQKVSRQIGTDNASSSGAEASNSTASNNESSGTSYSTSFRAGRPLEDTASLQNHYFGKAHNKSSTEPESMQSSSSPPSGDS